MTKEEVNELIANSIAKFEKGAYLRDELTIRELHLARNAIFQETISYWIDETSPDIGYDYETLGRLVYKLDEGLSHVILNDYIKV